MNIDERLYRAGHMLGMTLYARITARLCP